MSNRFHRRIDPFLVVLNHPLDPPPGSSKSCIQRITFEFNGVDKKKIHYIKPKKWDKMKDQIVDIKLFVGQDDVSPF